jgi:DeoR/GlpR family transcriptional regulator of sugar metabolism
MVGFMTVQCANMFITDKFFIGTDGFTEKFGFTGRDHQRSGTVRDMARRATALIVLTDSDKFGRQGVEGLAGTGQVTAVFTDDKIPEDKERFLREHGVEVHKVASGQDVFMPDFNSTGNGGTDHDALALDA